METFGPYLLVEKIASGGMAEIYRATRAGAGGLGRPVAIKRIRPEHARNAEFVQMLIDEANIAMRLAHANIAQVIDLERVGEDWGLVLELVEGVDLFQLERSLEQHERRLGVDECVHLTREMLLGLDAVHRLTDEHGAPLGMVHCDISPSNVMVDLDGAVKLIDFGVARATGIADGGMIGGKVRYRAPEQVRGDDLDPRSDLYSAGIVLWELLAGERVFESLSIEEVMERVEVGDIPPIESVRAGLPESLVAVVRRALEPEPRDRFAHAGAFLAALEALEVGRAPARSRRALSEIVRAVVASRRPPARKSAAPSLVQLAEEPSLEDVLEDELDDPEGPLGDQTDPALEDPTDETVEELR